MADEWEKLACRLLGEVLHLIERLLLLLSVPAIYRVISSDGQSRFSFLIYHLFFFIFIFIIFF